MHAPHSQSTGHRCGRRRAVALLVSAAVVLTACRDERSPTAASPPTVTVTAVGTATATAAAPQVVSSPHPFPATPSPIVASQAQQAQLLPATLPPASITEDPQPFTTAPTPARWQVYLVQDAAPPLLLYESHRWLLQPEWTADGASLAVLALGMERADPLPATRPAAPTTRRLAGLVILNPDTAQPADDLVLPAVRSALRAPDGRAQALQLEGLPNLTQRVVVVDRTGHSRQVVGIGERVELVGWAPDSSALLVLAGDRQSPGRGAIYLVPLSGAPVTPLLPEPVRSHQLRWSPDGGRLAYLADGDLVVLDRDSGQRRQLTHGHRYQHSLLSWSADGRQLIVAGDLLDVSTGALRHSLLSPEATIDAALSPDGQHLVATQWPSGASAACPDTTARLANRTLLADLATGEQRLLRECGDGFFAYVRWLGDNRHLLLTATNCWQCGGGPRQVLLLDQEQGQSQLLSDADEPHVWASPSPSAERVLISGSRLRLYTADGQLLQELWPPPGCVVTAAAWAPDGRRFVYLVGPSAGYP